MDHFKRIILLLASCFVTTLTVAHVVHSDMTHNQQTQRGCMMCHQTDSNTPNVEKQQPSDEPAIRTLKKHVDFLTSKRLEGRQTGSPGELIATEYVANTLQSLGYKGTGDNKTFFQVFYFNPPTAVKKKHSALEAFLES